MKTNWYKEMYVKVMDTNDTMQAHVLGHKMTGNCCFRGCTLPVFCSSAFVLWTMCKYIDFDCCIFFVGYSGSLLLYMNIWLNGEVNYTLPV